LFCRIEPAQHLEHVAFRYRGTAGGMAVGPRPDMEENGTAGTLADRIGVVFDDRGVLVGRDLQALERFPASVGVAVPGFPTVVVRRGDIVDPVVVLGRARVGQAY